MTWLRRSLVPGLVLLLAGHALGQEQVEVLRARRALSYLSSNGNGASIYRAEADVDLAVRSASYAKEVGVRVSTDEGHTYTETQGYWVERLSDGREHWRVHLDLGTLGRNVTLGGQRGDMGPLFARLDAFLRVAGHTTWDAHRAAALLAPVAGALPEARRAPHPVVVGDALYLVGGQERETYGFTVPDVLRLDPDTGEWTKVATVPSVPLTSAGTFGPTVSPEILAGYEVASVGRRLFVLGGTTIKIGQRLTSTLVLDLDTARWTVGPALPGPLFDRKPVVAGGALHLVPTSHARPAGDSDQAWVLDPGAAAWRTAPVQGLDLLAGERYVTAAVDGRLVLLGGRAGPTGPALHDAFAYDPATGAVTRLGSLQADLSGAEPAVALGGAVLVANVEPDLARGDAAALLFDPVAGDATSLPRRPLVPFEAVLGAAPSRVVAGPGGAHPGEVHAAFVFTGTSEVDTWLPEQGDLARGEARTVLRVRRDVGWGHRITVRGAAAPLGWWSGRGARWTDGDTWVFETTDLLEPVLAWKPLVDDGAWYPGADLRVRRGETMTVTWPSSGP
jgi:hypothetical protein